MLNKWHKLRASQYQPNMQMKSEPTTQVSESSPSESRESEPVQPPVVNLQELNQVLQQLTQAVSQLTKSQIGQTFVAPIPVAQVQADIPVAQVQAAVPVGQDEAAVPVTQVEAVIPVAEVESTIPVAQVEVAIPVAQVEAVVQEPKDESPTIVKPTEEVFVRVDPKFQKGPFEKFESEYSLVKRALHRSRGNMSGSRQLSQPDLRNPSFALLLANLEYLELVLQLMCACLPKEGVVDNFAIAKKVAKLKSTLRDLFEEPSPEFLTSIDSDSFAGSFISEFDSVKKSFQAARRADGSGKCRVSRKVYNNDVFSSSHFMEMTKFAIILTKACRILFCQSQKTWEAAKPRRINIMQNILSSRDNLIVQIPEQNDAVDPEVLKNLEMSNLTSSCSSAFKALSRQGERWSYINNDALRKQKNEQAIVVYRALWHTIVALGLNHWIASKTALSLRYKSVGELTDKKCEAYRNKNAAGVAYVWKPLQPFWDERNKSYDTMHSVLANSVPTSFSIEQANAFCLALLRYARAGTPVAAKRSPQLAAWMTLVSQLQTA